jgi:predicted RNase H-like nuclease
MGRKRSAKAGVAIGVDGCRSGWFYFALRKELYHFGTVPGVGDLLAGRHDHPSVFVDIPIGLLDSGAGGRECDREARKVLGPRRSSVFSAPVRSVLNAADYGDAGRRSIAATGRSLSRQAFGIVPKIRHVDMLMRGDPDARSMVRESHPEVCLWALAGGRPMAYSKKADEGFEERMEVLSQVWPEARRAVASARSRVGGSCAARDDIVDALVLALAAATPPSGLRTFPPRPERDAHGLPMEIVYPRPLLR